MKGTTTMKTDLTKVPAKDLIKELRNRKEIIAIQVWEAQDVFDEAYENCGYTEKEAKAIAAVYKKASKDKAALKEALEDCSEQWEKVHTALYMTAEDLGFSSNP